MLRATLHEQEIRRIVGAPGEGDRVVEGIAPPEAPESRCLYFIGEDISSTVKESLAAQRGCVVVVRQGVTLAGELGNCRILQVARPRAAMAKVLKFIQTEHRQSPWLQVRKISQEARISPLAVIDGDVEIGPGVVVEPFCTVGPDVAIGRGSTLRAGCRLYPRVSIGEESLIGANTVIGHEGYGFVRDEAGNKTRIPHLGGAIIGSHVEIGALSVVQSGTISPTTIDDYAKIDDNVGIAHNAHVGRNASITGGVVIGGSAVIGADAWIGINSSIRNGRRVGSCTLVGMDASVQRDITENSVARARPAHIESRSPDDDDDSIGFPSGTGRTGSRS